MDDKHITYMKELIEQLYPINAGLLGEGYDKRLEILNTYLPLEIQEIPSGTEFSTWTVPNEWVIRDAWVKYKGKKILDYTKNPLSVVIGSLPFSGTVSKEELVKHLYWRDDVPRVTPYTFKFYDLDWGFSIPKEKMEKLKEGEYEVFIDTEYKPGVMKIATHTIKGESDEEILLLAHLDHPYQANDNLSAIACLLETIKDLKSKYTIKLVFCPETIGSIAYAHTNDLSRVKFAIAVDICGNDDSILLLKAFDPQAWINRVAHCAFQIICRPYRKAPFRSTIGSDETVFNDPLIGIPSILLTTHSKTWLDYHTDEDTPDKINYEKITETAEVVRKIIEIAEKDYVPVRNFKGPLMRSRYKMQSVVPQVNLNYDYFFYLIDGKKTLAELCAEQELNFDSLYETLSKIEADGKISRGTDARKETL